mmetsp:Transcript_6228/g.10148  ORF Transcript_6228/g.10148 Transcript_6228/m.10148 type:complete len:288 (-) Transcript_6228:1887-2750(-)
MDSERAGKFSILQGKPSNSNNSENIPGQSISISKSHSSLSSQNLGSSKAESSSHQSRRLVAAYFKKEKAGFSYNRSKRKLLENKSDNRKSSNISNYYSDEDSSASKSLSDYSSEPAEEAKAPKPSRKKEKEIKIDGSSESSYEPDDLLSIKKQNLAAKMYGSQEVVLHQSSNKSLLSNKSSNSKLSKKSRKSVKNHQRKITTPNLKAKDGKDKNEYFSHISEMEEEYLSRSSFQVSNINALKNLPRTGMSPEPSVSMNTHLPNLNDERRRSSIFRRNLSIAGFSNFD